jgi:hypothetical protein
MALTLEFKFLHGLLTNINKNSGKKIKFRPPHPGPLGAILGDIDPQKKSETPLGPLGGIYSFF